MDYKLHFAAKNHTPSQLIIHSAFCKMNKDKCEPVLSHWDKDCKDSFKKLKNSKVFKGTVGEHFYFSLEDGTTVLAVGLGEKTKLESEILRKEYAKILKTVKAKYSDISVQLDSFTGSKIKTEDSLIILVEAFGLTNYQFNKHLSKKQTVLLKTVHIDTSETKSKQKAFAACEDRN